VNEIYSTILPENNAKVYKIMKEAENELIRFKVVADLSGLIDNTVYVDFLRDMPILSVRREPLEEVLNRFNKRLFDVVVSGLVTVFILSWLVPLLGLLIYLESPGPIFLCRSAQARTTSPLGASSFAACGPTTKPTLSRPRATITG
jgi:putative colanic acid biosynthesis UDP-glucose lipid carrier transferase